MVFHFHKIFILTIISFLFSNAIYSQTYYDYPVNIPIGGYRFDSTSYEIAKIIDQRDNKEFIGTVYHPVTKVEYLLRTRKGVEKTFKRIFRRAFEGTVTGDRQVLASIKHLELDENENNKSAKKGRDLRMGISVDYYEIDGEDLHFIRNDIAEDSGIFRFKSFPFNDFLYDFFDKSLREVDKYIKENPKAKSETKGSMTENTHSNIENQIREEKQPSLKNGEQFTNLDQIPQKIERPEFHSALAFERFYGNNANGGRFRYFGYLDTWNNNGWTGCGSFTVEIINLNDNPKNEQNIELLVDYSYLALGLGTMKSISNIIKLELGIQLGFGTENYVPSLSIGSRVESSNNFFAGFLNQRVHFVVGRGLGLVFTLGTHQSFFSGTDFLPSDIGYSVGGAIKF